jgi:3-oxoacyl-[acyl-carrier-protein] synthase-3
VYGLSIADAMIRSGQADTILLVGTEIISRMVDWTDRGTCILFGDGAGAVVMQADSDTSRGVLATCLASDGSMGDMLRMPAYGDKRFMHMKGSEVFKHAVRLMSEIARQACSQAGVSIEDADVIIPHQANIRIIRGLAEKLGVSMEKVVTNIEKFGNTSSASIPLALDDAWSTGRITDGTLAVLTALGGGVTVGGAVVRF